LREAGAERGVWAIQIQIELKPKTIPETSAKSSANAPAAGAEPLLSQTRTSNNRENIEEEKKEDNPET